MPVVREGKTYYSAVEIANDTTPIEGPFTWVNAGSSSKSRLVTIGAYRGAYLEAPAGAAADNLRIRKKPAPHGDRYQITAALTPRLVASSSHCGLCWRQNSDGKLVLFDLYLSNGADANSLYFGVYKYNSPTSVSAVYSGFPVSAGCTPFGSPLWLRIADNGVSRVCSYSADGIRFVDIHTIGRTDFLTADEVGYFCDSYNATYTAAVTVSAWIEEEWRPPVD